MKIGLNFDTVLKDIEKFQLIEGEKFFKEKFNLKVVNSSGKNVMEIFNCSKEQSCIFWSTQNILKFILQTPRSEAVDLIKQLNADGHNLYIFISEKNNTNNKISTKIINTVLKEFLRFNGIKYNMLIPYSDDNSKLEECKNNFLDVVIEDDLATATDLSQYLDAIYIDGDNDIGNMNQNLHKTDNINQIYDVIKAIKVRNETKFLNQEPLTGKASVDKPWLKHYTYQAVHAKAPEMKLNQYLRNSVKEYPNDIALYYSIFNKIKNKKFFKLVDDCAKSLLEAGVKEDDNVTICMGNAPEGYISMMAVNTIGAVDNMLNVLSSKNEIKQSLELTKSKVLIILDTNYNKIKDIVDEIPSLEKVVIVSPKGFMRNITKVLYTVTKERSNPEIPKSIPQGGKCLYWSDFMNLGKNYIDKTNEFMAKYKKGKPAVILRTSGTTKGRNSLPKMPVLSDDAYTAMVHAHKYTLDFNRGEKIVAIAPIHHGFGSSICMYLPHCLGVAPILEINYDEKRFAKMFLNLKPNHLPGPPTLFYGLRMNKYLQGKNLSFFNGYAVSGSDKMRLVDLEENTRFLREHGTNIIIRDGYGLSEGLASVAFQFFENGLIPLVNINVKIVEYGTQNEVNYNVPGEICFTGPTALLEYFMNQEATDATMQKHPDGTVWVHTGDAGHMNEEGIVSVIGRIKDMFISSGYNVYPSEVEYVVESHEIVKACAVIGIDHPKRQSVPLAYIVLKDGIEITDTVRDDIMRHCQDNLSKHAVPYKLVFGSEMPKTSMQKTDYESLKSMYKNILTEEKEKVKTIEQTKRYVVMGGV